MREETGGRRGQLKEGWRLRVKRGRGMVGGGFCRPLPGLGEGGPNPMGLHPWLVQPVQQPTHYDWDDCLKSQPLRGA